MVSPGRKLKRRLKKVLKGGKKVKKRRRRVAKKRVRMSARMVKHAGPRPPMQVICRIGILLLTIGTVLDNARTAAGTLLDDGPGAFGGLNVAVSWFCQRVEIYGRAAAFIAVLLILKHTPTTHGHGWKGNSSKSRAPDRC